jgi:hypothetical protein
LKHEPTVRKQKLSFRDNLARHVCMTLLAIALARAAAAHAQPVAVAAAAQDTLVCNGQPINSITVNTLPPAAIARSSNAIRRAVLSVLFQASTTEEAVARSFLLVRQGERCSMRRIDEAMRVLRAQPFIGSATATVFPDTGGGVRVEVETLDEIPVVIGGSVSGGISAITLGNSNISGKGFHAVARWRDGGFYRDAFALQLRKHGLFGRPIVLTADAQMRTHGEHFGASLSRPFFSNMQRFGWHIGAQHTEGYETFVRAGGSPLSLETERTQWDVGAVGRIGGRRFGFFLGPVAMFERSRPASNAVMVTDSGIYAPDADDLENRYGDVTTFRAGAAAGIRLLSYARVSGFDALAGEQDVARGLQLGVVAARGFEALGAEDLDDFGAIDGYLGFGGGRTFIGIRGSVEGQRPQDADEWTSVVASARAAAYFKWSEHRTWEISAEYSGGWRERLPLQLSLGQRYGGPRGFEGTALPGGRRAVARLERRQELGALGRYSHWGFALFADAARVWSGGVPFGNDDGDLHASAGISLLAAIPANSRRMLRVDVAVPITGGTEDSYRISFSARDLTRLFWREPRDVTRTRSVSLPAAMFGWP